MGNVSVVLRALCALLGSVPSDMGGSEGLGWWNDHVVPITGFGVGVGGGVVDDDDGADDGAGVCEGRVCALEYGVGAAAPAAAEGEVGAIGEVGFESAVEDSRGVVVLR